MLRILLPKLLLLLPKLLLLLPNLLLLLHPLLLHHLQDLALILANIAADITGDDAGAPTVPVAATAPVAGVAAPPASLASLRTADFRYDP